MSISGKTKEECTLALKTTNGDPNLAFEFLMQMGNMGEYGDEIGDDGYGAEDYGAEGEEGDGGAIGGNLNPFEILA